ncbi:MAG: hypothetical protein GIKADHBN_00274 [Phycisphaerales bacterium]|nr:hypothetical protein [Phycisphaerales bacterium]
MLTLWDLLPKSLRPQPAADKQPRPARPAVKPHPSRHKPPETMRTSRTRRPGASRRPAPDSMQARYDAVVSEMLARYGVRVRRWRTSMSGVAWTVTYQDGSVSRLIESPRPKGPMSAAIFLHEIGHHALGVGFCKPRCLEEYHAWAFAIEQMRACGLNITPAVERRMRRSLEYAVRKALRRGIQNIPAELAPYMPKPRS